MALSDREHLRTSVQEVPRTTPAGFPPRPASVKAA